MKYNHWRFMIGMTLLTMDLVNVYVDPAFYVGTSGKMLLLVGIIVSFFLISYSFDFNSGEKK